MVVADVIWFLIASGGFIAVLLLLEQASERNE